MFDQKFSDYLRNTIPEFIDINIEIGGIRLQLSDYDFIHALIAHNNVVNRKQENIAIFHPTGCLADVIFLVMAGIASYKESAIKNSNLKPEDLELGELVEYEGKIARYMGHSIDPSDGIDKFRLEYDDKYKNRIIVPIRTFFNKVTKYYGERTTTETLDSRVKKPDRRKETIDTLLNMGEQSINLADYAAFLVCNVRPDLIDILHETHINGSPFFKIFPSVKCTSKTTNRITRDLKKRRSIFYFTPSLSVVDDILHRQKSITALIADGKKVANAGSLLASIKSDYNLEDIFVLEDSSKISLAYDLSKNFNFKIWAWAPLDFKNLWQSSHYIKSRRRKIEENNEFTRFLENMVYKKNRLLNRLSRYNEQSIHIDYPNSFNTSQHNSLVISLSNIRNLNKARNDPSISAFLFSTSGVANRIFQSPLLAMDDSQIKSHIEILKKDLLVLPSELQNDASGIIQILEEASAVFVDNYSKVNALAKILTNNKKMCILVKRPNLVEPLRSYLESKSLYNRNSPGNLSIESATRRIDPSFDVLIWTFRPDLRQYSSAMFKAGQSIFLLYEAQERELAEIKQIHDYNLLRYTDIKSRAEILKVDASILGNGEIKQNDFVAPTFEPMDLDELLFTKVSFANVYGSRYGSGDTIPTKQVLFEDGFMAFFSKGHRISVINIEDEGVEVKNVDSLKIGDRVIFLKSERKTIFEDIMGYYGHKPEVIATIESAAAWHKALATFSEKRGLTPEQIRIILKERGLDREITTIKNWLAGETICPFDDKVIDIIAEITEDSFLIENKEKVKKAGKIVHGLHIKIGRYLAHQVTQSVTSTDRKFDDPVLKQKLNEISSYAEIAEVVSVGNEDLEINSNLINRLLAPEDL